MIRHSSSFLVSLIIHSLLFLALFYGYRQIIHHEPKEEKRVKINLCSLPISTQIKQKVQETKPKVPTKQKAEIKKVESKVNIEQKKKIKKVVQETKPKVIKEKVTQIKKTTQKKVERTKVIPEPKKITPVIQDTLPKKEIKSTPKLEKVQELPLMQETIKTVEPKEVETKSQKELRQQEQYISEHLKKIVQLLSENLYYPRSARKRNIQGKVMVKFKLSRSGKVSQIKIITSPNEILSRAALRTLKNLSGEFPSPPQELLLHLPISYKLNR